MKQNVRIRAKGGGARAHDPQNKSQERKRSNAAIAHLVGLYAGLNAVKEKGKNKRRAAVSDGGGGGACARNLTRDWLAAAHTS